MFVYQENERNTLRFKDSESGIAIELYYRTPTPEEYIKFSASMGIGITGTEDKQAQGEKILKTYLDVGVMILEGVNDGVFKKVSESGQEPKSFSSDPANPDYDPEWKKYVTRMVPDLIITLGREAFRGNGLVQEKN